MKRKAIISAILFSLGLIASGCLVVDDGGVGCYGDHCSETPGDIGFWWSFELSDYTVTDSCAAANVARVDVRIYDDYGDLEYAVMDRPCGDLGLDLLSFRPGWYDLQLSGRCPRGYITHEGWYELPVDSGYNDFGVLVLDYLGDCN